MPQKNLAQGESITIDLSKYLNGAVAITTAAETLANAVFDLEVCGVVDPSGAPEWLAIGTYDPVSRASQVHIIGTSKSGWADVPGYRSIRVKRTDGNVGNGTVAIDYREG